MFRLDWTAGTVLLVSQDMLEFFSDELPISMQKRDLKEKEVCCKLKSVLCLIHLIAMESLQIKAVQTTLKCNS